MPQPQPFQQSVDDSTVLVMLNVSAIPTATTQTITMPNKSGTLFSAASNDVTAITNMTATNVQDALAELQGDIDTLSSASTTGVYKGSDATVAALDVIGGVNGDWAILTVDDGGNQAGIYVTDGTNYSLAKEIDEPIAIVNYVGATAGTPGVAGYVPPAAAGEEAFFFTGAGTFVAPPAGTASASETVEGTAELATTAEVALGTDDLRIVTPLKMKQVTDTLVVQSNLASNAAGAGVGAAGVGIDTSGTGAGQFYTATTVEGVLEELGPLVSSGGDQAWSITGALSGNRAINLTAGMTSQENTQLIAQLAKDINDLKRITGL